MRISSAMIFAVNVATMQRQTASLLHTQLQVSTGRRILTPADDPVAAARALDVTQSREINSEYRTNQDNAKTSLALEESQLAAVGELIQNVQERAVQAGDGTLSAADRTSIAQDLRARFDQLLGIANSQDGQGQFLFSGYQGNTKPFSGNVASGVDYAGDDGQRALQVSAARQLPVSDPGSDVFMRIREGNGRFAAAAAAGNQGSGLIDAGNALGAYGGHRYTLSFTSPTTYTVTDIDPATGPPGTTGAPIPYQSGTAIALDGGAISVSISGAPAAGDSFSVTPSANQSLFETLANLIKALDTSITPTSTATELSNRIGEALTNLAQVHDNILRVRASVGSRLNEVDTLQNVGDAMHLEYEETLSRLQDVDYAQAISQLTQQQTNLQAAQKSFLSVSGLSLFNYL